MIKGEKEAINVFKSAVELSRNSSMLFIGAIAFYQEKSKDFYYEWASKSDQCRELLSIIQTNCEALTFKAMRLKQLDIRQGLFMLEREFGAKEDQAPVTIKIEGMSNEEVDDMIKEL